MKTHTNNYLIVATCIFCLMNILSCRSAHHQVSELNVSFIHNINKKPHFSWKIAGNTSDLWQSAYRILIADNIDNLKKDVGNIWDTGIQRSDFQQHSKYSGGKLKNGESYYAKIQIWDQNDRKSSWSNTVQFFVPIDYPADWQAEWITYQYHPDAALPVFRNSFQTESRNQIQFARLYVSAPGFYEAYLNGNKIGENVLDPGQTNYEDYAFYTAYEIDLKYLQDKNVLGIMLGNGWYNQNQVWDKRMIYGQPVFICQLVVQYKNGTREIVGSDTNWKWRNGPITYSNIYGGETYDANLEINDWFIYELQDQSWKNALLADTHPVDLFEQFADPIQKMDSLDVANIIDLNNGKYILDFGQNFSGWARLSIRGEKGQKIVMRHVEVLDSNNNINPVTTGVTATKVIQTATYVCKGQGLEVWEPRFTYFGFRFVEVEGLKASPAKDLLKGIVVYSSVPHTGFFNCSEENINRLHKLANWTIISNIHGIPTDCPHREKCGWTGDVQAFAQAFMYNYDAQRFLTKYLFDLRSSAREEQLSTYYRNSFYDRISAIKPKGIPPMVVPGKRTGGIASPDWGTVTVQLPWYLYLYYGDSLVLNEFYPDMKTWVEYIHSKKENGIIPHGLGDWCPPQGVRNIDCPVPISSTAFHILDVGIMKRTANVFEKKEDYEYFSSMLEELKRDFNIRFFDSINHTYGSQTADAMALDLEIVPEKHKRRVASSIINNINEKFDGFISTGIFGLSRIFKVLSENGFEEEAFRLLTKRGHNSFAYMWEEFDATTLWEVLPVLEYNERSHSHPMQAGYDAWFYSGLAGINPVPDAPGFKEIVFKPYLTRQMNSAEATHESLFGTIRSSWSRNDDKMSWELTIPNNSRGKVYIPNYGKPVNVKINNRTIDVSNYNNEFVYAGEYQSGNYKLDISFNN
jgi:alpha-L-rhamnosidase